MVGFTNYIVSYKGFLPLGSIYFPSARQVFVSVWGGEAGSSPGPAPCRGGWPGCAAAGRC